MKAQQQSKNKKKKRINCSIYFDKSNDSMRIGTIAQRITNYSVESFCECTFEFRAVYARARETKCVFTVNECSKRRAQANMPLSNMNPISDSTIALFLRFVSFRLRHADDGGAKRMKPSMIFRWHRMVDVLISEEIDWLGLHRHNVIQRSIPPEWEPFAWMPSQSLLFRDMPSLLMRSKIESSIVREHLRDC